MCVSCSASKDLQRQEGFRVDRFSKTLLCYVQIIMAFKAKSTCILIQILVFSPIFLLDVGYGPKIKVKVCLKWESIQLEYFTPKDTDLLAD